MASQSDLPYFSLRSAPAPPGVDSKSEFVSPDPDITVPHLAGVMTQ